MKSTPLKQLFRDFLLSDILRQRQATALSDVETLDSNRLLQTGIDDLVKHVLAYHRIEAPSLIEGTEQIAQSEVRVPSPFFVEPVGQGFDISQYRDLEWEDGISISMDIELTGDRFFFQTCPSSFSPHSPSGWVGKDFLTIYLNTADLNPEVIRRGLDSQLTHIRECLDSVRGDIERFNTDLETAVRSAILKRRERLLTHAGVAAQIGYPLKERSDAIHTFAAPGVRRKLVPMPIPTKVPPSVPEPVLLEEHYEQVLNTIYHMAQVLERSPSAFRTMDEEALRTIFLVALNGIYEGHATGETFNYGGKTDILIRQAGKNIFIAECKFWNGPKSLEKAITQILGYSVWRDSKLAILLFNRQREISTVLEKIPGILREHDCFKRPVAAGREGEFRAVLKHPDDPHREVILTVLTFDVPGESGEAPQEYSLEANAES